MRKILILIAVVFFIVGCSESDDDIDATTEGKEIVQVTNEDPADEETEAEGIPLADRESLPFDVKEFKQIYESKYEEFLDGEPGDNIVIRDETILMLEASVNEGLILLYTLNELTGGNNLGEYAEQFSAELLDDTYFVDEIIIDGLEIHINAIDINYVAISVFKE